MTGTKYIGYVYKENISIVVMHSVGEVVMECVIETKASTVLHLVEWLRRDLRVTFEEGTWAAWLYELLKPHVTEVVKSDRIDARKLAEQLYSIRESTHCEC